MKNKRLIGILLIAAIVLLVPLIAMQFYNEMHWTSFDFLVAAVLIFGAGLLCELVLRKVKKIEYRIAICIILLLALFLVWAELAVGIFGTPFGGH